MSDIKQIVHDLAMLYAKQRFAEYQSSPNEKKFPTAASALADFYTEAVSVLAQRKNDIESAYCDDDGYPFIQ